MSFTTVLFQMFALLIMIAAGMIAAKKDMWDQHTNAKISKLIVNIFNPLLILSSAANAVGKIPKDQLAIVALIAIGMFLIFIVIGMILTPLFTKDRDQKKIYQLMFVFSNLGFIGIPVVNSILGTSYVVYVSEFTLVYTLIFYTYGVAVMDGKLDAASLKAMINPGTIFGLLALFVIVADIQLPGFILTAVTYLGNATSPLALMAVGFMIASADAKQIFGNVKIYIFSVIKLLVIPLLLFWVLRLLPIDAELIPLCMVMFGMPVGNMPLMLAAEKGIDSEECASAILLSTVMCVVTIPILLALIGV